MNRVGYCLNVAVIRKMDGLAVRPYQTKEISWVRAWRDEDSSYFKKVEKMKIWIKMNSFKNESFLLQRMDY